MKRKDYFKWTKNISESRSYELKPYSTTCKAPDPALGGHQPDEFEAHKKKEKAFGDEMFGIFSSENMHAEEL